MPLRLAALTIIVEILVASYIIIVALRNTLSRTTLGSDVIVLLYASTTGMFAVSLGCWFLGWIRRKRDRWSFVALGLATILLGGWLYLNLSGKVISYEQWIHESKQPAPSAEPRR